MRSNNVALCHVHRHFGQAWYQETEAGICFKKRQSSVSVWENILIFCWLSEIFCSSGSMNGKHQQNAQQMQGWLAEQGCGGSGAGAWCKLGHGGHRNPKLTQSDSCRRQPACLVPYRSVQPFCRNSRFCPIRGKNAGMGHFRGKVRGERINRCQPALGRRRTGLSHGIDATLIPLLVWAQSTSVTDRSTNMLLAKRRYTSVLWAKKGFLYSKYVVYQKGTRFCLQS